MESQRNDSFGCKFQTINWANVIKVGLNSNDLRESALGAKWIIGRFLKLMHS